MHAVAQLAGAQQASKGQAVMRRELRGGGCACSGRVTWEFWTSSNDGCGNGCDRQAAFKKAMRSDAQDLEQVGFLGSPWLPLCCTPRAWEDTLGGY